MSKRPLDATTAEAKKYKSALDTMADEWTCPITSELPLDPVMAEDGRVYERSAIEGWFAGQPEEAEVKSPVTDVRMGKKLFPAVQVRNNLKAMVQSGALSGDKADAWKKRLGEEQEVIDMQKEAEGGDVTAVYDLGFWHRNGTKGLAKDDKKAFGWFKKAAGLNFPPALGQCGCYYVNGDGGVEKDKIRGFVMLGQAAALGSEHACYVLGWVYAYGHHGVKKDPAEAAKWYRRMDGCKYKLCTEEGRADAAEWLRLYDAGEY